MRSRTLILACAGLNVVLAVALVFAIRKNAELERAATDVSFAPAETHPRTNILVRRLNFTWHEVESEDYVTYIENLRGIGCPERTIRDIIVADVNQMYLQRRATEILSADYQWWRSEPDPELLETAAEQIRRLDEERRALLTQLLGPGWEQTVNPLPPALRTGISLSGPVLGELSPEIKRRVYEIAANSQDETRQLIEIHEQQGLRVDPVELARLRGESRRQLAEVLAPAELEEFLLRYSHTATRMRDELAGLDVSPEDFRNLFRARDPYDRQEHIYYEGDNPTLIKLRENAEREREAAIEQTLGPEHYSLYRMNQDPMFREARSTVEELGAPPDLVVPIFQINQLSEAERRRIRDDATLTVEQKIDALAEVQAEQQKSLERLLGLETLRLAFPD